MAIGLGIPIITSDLLVDTIESPIRLRGISLIRSKIEDAFDSIGFHYPFRRVKRVELKTIPSNKVVVIDGKIVCHPYYLRKLLSEYNK